MEVTKVSLKNFLSYGSAEVTFQKGLNFVYGANASGKTNLIDSVYLASVGRSSRHSRDKELINWDTESGALVTVTVQKRFGKHTVEIYIDPQGKKRILVDGLPLSKIGELMGVLNVVFFSPAEIRLVRESPADRRRFLDISLCQQSKTYFYTLQRYNNLLVQRNKLLKTYKGRPSLAKMLEIVDGDFVRAAAFIMQERKRYIEHIAPFAKEEHYKLTDGKEELRLVYETEAVRFDNIADDLSLLMEDARENDCRFEYSTIGPHRDDMKITASGVDLRKFGSQGQQRSAVLSLKLAEIESFKERTGETPILLLDDVMSELDTARRAALFNAIQGAQTIVTCTEPEDMLSTAAYFEVKERGVTRTR